MGDSRSNDSWMRRLNLLPRLNPMDVMFFEQAMQLLFNTKDGSVVVNNKLVPSRAGDVESKTVSQRKTGKEGPIADCLADSLIGILIGMGF